ncbi:MAG: DNA-3-methyladenine glycosylase [Thermoanaerobaculia bacterium]|jgi:3-methyladenine DNA glycosylase/8-oxoguanine DNA glycosylase
MTIPPFDLAVARDHVARRDRALARVIRKVGDCRLEIAARQTPYEALLESIVYQQLSGKAAASIWGKLCTRFGARRGPKPEQVAGATLEQLRAVGLSRSKAAAAQDLAKKAIAGEIPTRAAALRMSDDELVELLTEVRGIGRWTVEMFLIFTLGRPDVLPLDDYGVRKGFAQVQGRSVLPKPKELANAGERWRPYRTVASWYLWRANDVE